MSILKSYGKERKRLIKTDKLKGIFAEKGLSQVQVAKLIGVTPKTFYEKMSKGVFGSDEIQIMIDEFHIKNPTDIFLPISNLKSYQKERSGKSSYQCD